MVVSLPAGARTGRGKADLIACLQGQFIAPEVKTGGGKPTPRQSDFLHEVRSAGGLGFIAREVNHSLEAVDRFLLTHTWEGIVAENNELFDDLFTGQAPPDVTPTEPPPGPRARIPRARAARRAAAPPAPATEPQIEVEDEEIEVAPAPPPRPRGANGSTPAVTSESPAERLMRIEQDVAQLQSSMNELLELTDVVHRIDETLGRIMDALEVEDEPPPTEPQPAPLPAPAPAASGGLAEAETDDDEYEDLLAPAQVQPIARPTRRARV